MFGFVSCLTKTIDKLQIIVDTRNSVSAGDHKESRKQTSQFS